MDEELMCYYAHCMSLYGTPQEERDIALLARLGFNVVNPGSREVEDLYQEWKEEFPTIAAVAPMEFFVNLVKDCDVLAFRGVPFTALITQGVATEIRAAAKYNIPVIELPTNPDARVLSLDRTRTYLHEVGQR